MRLNQTAEKLENWRRMLAKTVIVMFYRVSINSAFTVSHFIQQNCPFLFTFFVLYLVLLGIIVIKNPHTLVHRDETRSLHSLRLFQAFDITILQFRLRSLSSLDNSALLKGQTKCFWSECGIWHLSWVMTSLFPFHCCCCCFFLSVEKETNIFIANYIDFSSWDKKSHVNVPILDT